MSISPRNTTLRLSEGSVGTNYGTNQPSTPRRGARNQCGITHPVVTPDVRSGRSRLEQLSTPRFRVTGNDFEGNGIGYFGYSPRMTRDQHVAFEAHEKMLRRVHDQQQQWTASSAASRDILPSVHNNSSNKLPTAVELLGSLKNVTSPSSSSTTSRSLAAAGSGGKTRLASTSAHDNHGIAGLLLATTGQRVDECSLKGTKLQVHELTNTQVRQADVDGHVFPFKVPTSGRRKPEDESNNSPRAQQQAPQPSAVRSLAVSGIDTSRAGEKPQAPQYFQVEHRTTRNGRCHYPQTMHMSQPARDSGQYLGSDERFDPNTRGLHNASSYVLEDKLRKKATDELRQSKCCYNEEAVVARAQAEIDKKRAKIDARVAAKRIRILDYEARVGAGM